MPGERAIYTPTAPVFTTIVRVAVARIERLRNPGLRRSLNGASNFTHDMRPPPYPSPFQGVFQGEGRASRSRGASASWEGPRRSLPLPLKGGEPAPDLIRGRREAPGGVRRTKRWFAYAPARRRRKRRHRNFDFFTCQTACRPDE